MIGCPPPLCHAGRVESGCLPSQLIHGDPLYSRTPARTCEGKRKSGLKVDTSIGSSLSTSDLKSVSRLSNERFVQRCMASLPEDLQQKAMSSRMTQLLLEPDLNWEPNPFVETPKLIGKEFGQWLKGNNN